ncbi:hypothetical protein [Streptomyces sp. NPDC060035]|uniref:hypothetical protein n=1 Tax=Streptomyces sp. NPDC060035 TaxID=3347044 RepID=UPI0036A38F53
MIKKLAGVLVVPALLAGGGVLTTTTPAHAATSIAISKATIDPQTDRVLNVSLTYACDTTAGTATIDVAATQEAKFAVSHLSDLTCDGTQHTANATLTSPSGWESWYSGDVKITVTLFDSELNKLGYVEGSSAIGD